MSQSEVAEQLGITRGRVSQIELQALAKLHVLLMGEDLDEGRITERRELRLLVAQSKNAQRKKPRPPCEVVERFREREELLRHGRARHGAGGQG